MEILIALLLLLSLATILGKLFERIGVTEIVGQIIAGMILSPAILGVVQPSPVLSGIAEVAIFFILLFIGLQITTEVLTNHLKSATAFTLSSFVVPVSIMAIIAVFVFHLGVAAGIITAVAIGVPSISIISVLVYRYAMINLEDGKRILSGVIMTDILAFVALAAALKASHLAGVIISIIIFIAVLLYIDRTLKYHDVKIRGFFERMIKEKEEAVVFAIIIILSLVLAAILQLIGITYVLGALFAGMLVHKTSVGPKATRILENTFRRLNDSFFIPVFFSIAGLDFAVPSLTYTEVLLSMVIISALVGGALNYFVSKNRLSKISSKESIGILGSRGAVGIIIATLALQSGIITNSLYTVVLVGTIILSLIMPLLLSKKARTPMQAAAATYR
ncbi:cation:proton antiporter [Candidatus Marsarchaeota archaeon]|nr:cation:proton antiporter [Candidatus Marsarchaeota archaeon]